MPAGTDARPAPLTRRGPSAGGPRTSPRPGGAGVRGLASRVAALKVGQHRQGVVVASGGEAGGRHLEVQLPAAVPARPEDDLRVLEGEPLAVLYQLPPDLVRLGPAGRLRVP